MIYNKIRLLRGVLNTETSVMDYKKGDAINFFNTDPEVLKEYNITDIDKAKEDLAKYHCSYGTGRIEEYGLEYYEEDENGDFIDGSDYELAREESK